MGRRQRCSCPIVTLGISRLWEAIATGGGVLLRANSPEEPLEVTTFRHSDCNMRKRSRGSPDEPCGHIDDSLVHAWKGVQNPTRPLGYSLHVAGNSGAPGVTHATVFYKLGRINEILPAVEIVQQAGPKRRNGVSVRASVSSCHSGTFFLHNESSSKRNLSFR